jgi:hypothetical protein
MVCELSTPLKERSMPRVRTFAFGFAAAAALMSGSAARAQDDAPPQAPPWEVSFTPYIFIPGVHGNLGAAADVPPQPVHADFPQIFNKLDGAFMGSAEFRYGNFGLIGDYLTLSISGDHSVTFNNLAASGSIKLSTSSATVAGFWRAYDDDPFTADVLLGARYTSMKNEVGITVGSRSVSGSADDSGWDPIIGVRGSWRTGRRGSLSGYADFGGGGFTSSVWQALGTYNWRFTDSIIGSAGWRFYGVNLSKGPNKYDILLTGPIVGVKFRFW